MQLHELIEILAGIEHQRWAHWQAYVHAHGVLQDDGSVLLPANLVERWNRQIASPFADLAEAEKESDREQVRVYLKAMATYVIGIAEREL